MKNKFLLPVCLLLIVLMGSACHKCVECIEYNSVGGKALEYPEVCGKRDDIDTYRKHMEEGQNPGNNVKCEERKTTLF